MMTVMKVVMPVGNAGDADGGGIGDDEGDDRNDDGDNQ